MTVIPPTDKKKNQNSDFDELSAGDEMMGLRKAGQGPGLGGAEGATQQNSLL